MARSTLLVCFTTLFVSCNASGPKPACNDVYIKAQYADTTINYTDTIDYQKHFYKIVNAWSDKIDPDKEREYEIQLMLDSNHFVFKLTPWSGNIQTLIGHIVTVIPKADNQYNQNELSTFFRTMKYGPNTIILDNRFTNLEFSTTLKRIHNTYNNELNKRSVQRFNKGVCEIPVAKQDSLASMLRFKIRLLRTNWQIQKSNLSNPMD